MKTVSLNIDGQPVEVAAGTTILDSVEGLDIYIPRLCHHTDLPPAKGSKSTGNIFQGDRKIENAMLAEPGQGRGLCMVEVQGEKELVGACGTGVADRMLVFSMRHPNGFPPI